MAAQDRLTLRNVYLYLVCLITLVVSIFAAVQLVRSVVGLVYPDPGTYRVYVGTRRSSPASPSAGRRSSAWSVQPPPCSSPARCTSTTGGACSRSCRSAALRTRRAQPLPERGICPHDR